MRGAFSAAILLLVGTDGALVIPNSNICQAGALVYGYIHMKGLVYTKYRQNIGYFFALWMGRSQYLDNSNQ